MSWLEDPVTLVVGLPAFALPLFVFVSAALEYVFPPYWGDMFMLLGFFLAGQGASPLPLIFAAAFLGSVAGSAGAFVLGRRYGMAIVRKVYPWRPSGSRQRIRELLLRFGERVLIANRFVPFIRGLLLYGAGALGLRFGPAIGWSALSNLGWTTFLMAAGVLTADSWEEILERFRQTHQLMAVVAVVLVVAWAIAAVWWAKRRQQQDA